ncbi:MAG TPA: tetratricopeptide repeat protein [Xanthomonadaceae bacterium]|nr:tetratricopeptide repeat protein [Xanthomonadaceae bacterium]
MSGGTWRAAKQIFLSVVEAAPEQRALALDDPEIDPDVRALVESMLTADAELAQSPEHPVAKAHDAVEDAADRRLEGARLGAYRILRLLGRGGMGVVYLAEREQDGTVQRVALKLVRSGGFGADGVRRFQLERQLLARLEHPAIARLIDAGSIDGLPYYAMEYVDGEPLLQYCDRLRLDLGQRLRLVREVCTAVAHAHRSLVVHRDVKPSNVMVDRDGRPRLLDFGIAKALDAEAVAATEETGTHNRFFSPHCTAPELLTGGPVTTACDTYSLGALLYEALCAVPPLLFATTRIAEIEAAILHQPPLRPSEQVAALPPELRQEMARNRGLQSGQGLVTRLRGDLDVLVLRALAKEPSRRYPSVDALIEDIDRHLEARPLVARPDSIAYRVGKFVRRNFWPLALTATATAAVLIVAAMAVLQAQRVAAERDVAVSERANAEQIGAFLIDTFSMADPTRTLGDQISARQILDQAMLRLETKPDAGDTVRSRILGTMARAYLGLGRSQEAEDVAMRAAAAARNDEERAGAHRLLADILNVSGRFEAALEQAEFARQLRDDNDARATMAPILANLDRSDEAEALYREVLASIMAQGADAAVVASAKARLARHLRNMRKHEESRALYRQALDDQRRVLPKAHPAVAETLAGLGSVERALGHTEDALAMVEESLEVYRAVYGNDHPIVGRAWGSLSNTLAAAGRDREATEAMTRALELIHRYHGEHSAMAAMAHYNLGRILYDSLLDPEAAEPHFRAAVEAAEISGSGGNLPVFQLGLAAALNALARPQEARPLLEVAHRIELSRGVGHTRRTTFILSELGESLRLLGHFEEAATLLGQAVAQFEADADEGAPGTLTARRRLEATLAHDSTLIDTATGEAGD